MAQEDHTSSRLVSISTQVNSRFCITIESANSSMEQANKGDIIRQSSRLPARQYRSLQSPSPNGSSGTSRKDCSSVSSNTK